MRETDLCFGGSAGRNEILSWHHFNFNLEICWQSVIFFLLNTEPSHISRIHPHSSRSSSSSSSYDHAAVPMALIKKTESEDKWAHKTHQSHTSPHRSESRHDDSHRTTQGHKDKQYQVTGTVYELQTSATYVTVTVHVFLLFISNQTWQWVIMCQSLRRNVDRAVSTYVY